MIVAMKNVILAGVCIKDDAKVFQMKMDECIALCNACQLNVVETITQSANSMNTISAFRKGKLDELRILVEELDVDFVVFYNSLSVQMAERISAVVGCNVIDRTALILDIFSSRARSRQAKLQTEMARLQYDLPRLLNSDNDRERERGGGVTNRGSGEMRSAIVARKYQKRIQDLKQELKKIESQRQMDERRRSKTLLRRVALVGYTNAGKSSFMNCLIQNTEASGNAVFEKDMLFATLDTSVRKIVYDKKTFFLYDTVGFVSDLPHTLVEAFKSTLDAARDADLLVEIVDVSDDDYETKMEVTENTLREIGAGEIPVLRIFNKVDLLEDTSHLEGVCVSAKNGNHMDQAMKEILKLLYPSEESMYCLLPYGKINMFDEYRQVLHIDIVKQDEEGMTLYLQGPSDYIHAFDLYQIREGQYE